MQHTDIKNQGIILQMIPERFRDYGVLARLDRPIGTWLLLLPCWWSLFLSAKTTDYFSVHVITQFVLLGLGAIIMRGAGCVINDIWDRDFDARVERTKMRPLASGAITLKQAQQFLAGLMGMGAIILLAITVLSHSWTPLILGFLAIPLIVTYPYMKRITWYPQAFLGITFNWGALMGWASYNGLMDLPAFLLYAGGFFWTLGYDTIYAHQDKEDDILVGVKSTALKLGAHSKIWVAGFYSIAWLLFLLAGMLALYSVSFVFMMLVVGGHFVWQLRRWNIDDPASSLRIFKSNRDFGLMFLAAILLSTLAF